MIKGCNRTLLNLLSTAIEKNCNDWDMQLPCSYWYTGLACKKLQELLLFQLCSADQLACLLT